MSKINILKLAKDINEPRNTELEFLRAIHKSGIEPARINIMHKTAKNDNRFFEIIINDISAYDLSKIEKCGFYHLVTRSAYYYAKNMIEITFIEERLF